MRYQELLFSASVLGAAIALHNCRREYALRTVDFPAQNSAAIELTHYPYGGGSVLPLKALALSCLKRYQSGKAARKSLD
jgi:hypothetical protein